MSRNAAGKGRAVLEGVGLSPEAIEMCYRDSFYKEEEAVQSGLHRWRDGEGASPTWAVLLEAMDYAEIGVQHMTALEEAVLKGTVHSQLVNRVHQHPRCPFHCDQLLVPSHLSECLQHSIPSLN